MRFLYSPYTVPLFLGSITSIAVAFYSWKRRSKAPIAKTLTLIMFALALWAAGYALQLAGADLETKIFWRHIKNVGVVLTPTLWLIATLQYTGRNKAVTRNLVLFLAIEPIIGMTMDLTSAHHHFFIKEVVMQAAGNIYILDNVFGPWFWINVVYSYLLFITSTILFINTFFRVRKLYKNQILVLLSIALFPWGENIFYVSTLLFKWHSGVVVDLTPFFFVIASLLLAWGTFSLQLLDVVPIARDVILQNMKNGVLVLDTKMTIVDFSPIIEPTVNKTEDTLIGQSAYQVLRQWDELCQAIKKQKTAVGEISVERDNTLKTYEWRISELTTPNNILIGWVVVLFEMTRLKDIEFALQQSNRELHNQIEQREKLIADLDAFAHTVAHDLQNPLAIIIGYADVISMELNDNDEELNDYVIRIEETALKMGRIINELMFLAQVRKKNVVLYPLDTRKILIEVEKRLSKMIDDYHVELIMPDHWIPAMGYAPWIEEVWENYISNAIKYGGKPPVVEIGSIIVENNVQFWVKDNGDGLTLDMQKNIFEDSVYLAEKKNGHGLGLPVVRRILEKQGGLVNVMCSEVPGEGCTFSFMLPMVPTLESTQS